MSAPAMPSGYPPPLQRSWWWRITGTASRSRPNLPTIRAPSSEWRLITSNSSSVSRGLREDRVGNSELADVVEQRAEAQAIHLRTLEPQLFSERERQLLYAQRVARG